MITLNILRTGKTVSRSAMGENSFAGSDSIGVKVRVISKFTEIVLECTICTDWF